MTHDAWQAGMMIVGAQFAVWLVCVLLAALTLHFRRGERKLDIRIAEDWKRLESGK